MGQLVYPVISVEGDQILEGASIDIKIFEKMADHCQFKISCPAEALEGTEGYLGETSKDLIGSTITINFFEGEDVDSSKIFNGVITKIVIKKTDAAAGHIKIIGYGPTIFLENGKDCKSHEEKTLKKIIVETLVDYPQDMLNCNISPVFSEQLLYTVQYKESDFEFIKRLAARHGEWFYYDGISIRIGPVANDEKNLEYGRNLQKLIFKMQSKPQNHEFLAYDFVESDYYNSSLQDFNENVANPYIGGVIESSKKIYTKKPQSIYNHLLMEKDGKAQLEDVVKKNLQNALNVIQLSGESDEVSLSVGDKIKITGENMYDISQEDDYGSYIVTEITHKCSPTGSYRNKFTAIPADTKIPPYFNAEAIPFGEKQSATVTDNDDPKGIGRVRVQYAWQKSFRGKTPWIRVLTPYAGSGKGFYFIPEKGEEVLIDYESSNAEKPYVAGAHYNGKANAKAFKSSSNSIKAIKTNNGHCLMFIDGGDKEGINIADNNGNYITFSSKHQTINIRSEKKISSFSDDIVIQAKYILILGNDRIDIDNKGNTIKLSEGQEIVVNANKKIEITGDDFYASGKTIKINGSSLTEIKGGQIKLNP